MHGLAQAVSGNVKFKISKNIDKSSVFSKLVHQQTADENSQRVLLGALSDNIQTVLNKEKPQSETFTLLQMVEFLELTEFNLFQKVSNK